MKRDRSREKKIRCSITFTQDILDKLDNIASRRDGNRSSTVRYLVRKEKVE